MALEQIISVGERLGYTDDGLRAFVRKEQDRLRDERAAERAEKQAEIAAKQAEREREFAAKQAEIAVKQAEQEREFTAKQAEIAVKQAEQEMEEKQKEHEFKEREAQAQRDEAQAQRTHELEVMTLRSSTQSSSMNVSGVSQHNYRVKIPPFDDVKDNLDDYLRRFARYVVSQHVDKSDLNGLYILVLC